MRRKIALVILIVLVILGFFTVRAVLSAKGAIATAQKAAGAAKIQDLDATKAYLADSKKQFGETQKDLLVFTPLRIIPLIGWYVADAQRGVNAAIYGLDGGIKFVDAVTPYADVLGLKGKGTFLGGTAQERLAKAIETLSKVAPQIDDVGRDLGSAKKEVDQIGAWRYPNFLPGHPGSKIDTAKKGIDQIESLLVDSKPLLVVLPKIMGEDRERKYLILFQNDKELRPTGGFITAYAVFRVNKGVITSEGSDDIYRLDDTLLKKVPPPPAIVKYLPGVSSLNLRDTNLSPDYRASMEQFEQLYQYTQGKKDIDGIVALDTQFVSDMMKVLGPIDAYGTKFTPDKTDACDCPQIIYELEKYADQRVGYANGARKDIIGVLMQQMMAKAFNAPKSSWPNLLETGINSLRQKHLLLYFHDQESQNAAEILDFAGRLNQYDGDYLHINEANFAGAKSNLYIQEKVSQTVQKDGDKLKKTLTINYKYPKAGDDCSLERKGGLCLAGIYRDYIRIYAPKGSTLTKSSGAEVNFTAHQELDKTYFDGFFTLRPQGTAKLTLEYTVPVKVGSQYKLLIQKQPGTDNIMYDINAFGKRQNPFPLDTDKELIVKP